MRLLAKLAARQHCVMDASDYDATEKWNRWAISSRRNVRNDRSRSNRDCHL